MGLKRLKISRECVFCRSKVEQGVTFRENKGKITLETWRTTCPVCKGFLKTPTLVEIRRAMILKEQSS